MRLSLAIMRIRNAAVVEGTIGSITPECALCPLMARHASLGKPSWEDENIVEIREAVVASGSERSVYEGRSIVDKLLDFNLAA